MYPKLCFLNTPLPTPIPFLSLLMALYLMLVLGFPPVGKAAVPQKRLFYLRVVLYSPRFTNIFLHYSFRLLYF